MRQKSETAKPPAEHVVKDIRRATRNQYSAEEKIRIVLEGLRGDCSIAELCRREGIAESLYYSWSKEFLEAIANLTPADVYFGCGQTILLERERIKRLTIQSRRLDHCGGALLPKAQVTVSCGSIKASVKSGLTVEAHLRALGL